MYERRAQPGDWLTPPDPTAIRTPADLVRHLDTLRVRAAGPHDRIRVSLERLAAETGVPRSTIHAYLSGQRLPGSGSLDLIVTALGASDAERPKWAEALERLIGLCDEGRGSAEGRPPTVWPPAACGNRATEEPLDTATVSTPVAISAVHASPAPPLPRQLPSRPARLTGRATELHRLDEALRADDERARVAVITGTGGLGKSTLALEWAHGHSKDFPDGHLWVDLCGFGPATPLQAGDALERMLRSLGVGTTDLPPDVDSRAALFRSVASGRRLLVVLDNARDTAQVMPLLAGTPGIFTIVTSRDALRSLVLRSGAGRVTLSRLSDEDSVALLCADLPQTAVAALDATDIARHCEGLPLALAIVRERLSNASFIDVTGFADDLRRSRLAALDLRDSADEVSVAGALRWSFEALPPLAARCFCLLPLVGSPVVDVDCVAALLGSDEATAQAALDRLSAASLVDRSGHDRVRLHDVVADFASSRSTDLGTDVVAEARERLLCHLAKWSEAVLNVHRSSRLRLLDPPDGVEHVAPPHFDDHEAASAWAPLHADALYTAITAALDRGAVVDAASLTERSFRALFNNSDMSRYEPIMSRLIDAAADDLRIQMVGSHCLGLIMARSGRCAEAEPHMVRAGRLADRLGEAAVRNTALSNLGLLRSMSGDLDGAAADLAAAYEGMAACGGPVDPTLQSLIQLHLRRGDVEEAMRWLDLNKRSTLRLRPSDVHRLWCVLDTARLSLQTGDTVGASVALDGVIRDCGSANHEIICITNQLRATALTMVGDLPAAEKEAQAGLAIARRLGSREHECQATAVLADVLQQCGRHEEALNLLIIGLTRARSGSLRFEECTMLFALGRSQAALGIPAAATLQAARAMAQQAGYAPLLSSYEVRPAVAG